MIRKAIKKKGLLQRKVGNWGSRKEERVLGGRESMKRMCKEESVLEEKVGKRRSCKKRGC